MSYARGGHYSFYGSAGTWQAWGEECVYVSPRMKEFPRIIADGAPDALLLGSGLDLENQRRQVAPLSGFT